MRTREIKRWGTEAVCCQGLWRLTRVGNEKLCIIASVLVKVAGCGVVCVEKDLAVARRL